MMSAWSPCGSCVQDHTSLRGLPLTASASMIAGFFAAACSLPFDFVKTRIQKMKPDAQGKVPYAGFVDCFVKVRALWLCGGFCFPVTFFLLLFSLLGQGPLPWSAQVCASK